MNEIVLNYLTKHSGLQDAYMPFFTIEPEYIDEIKQDATIDFLDNFDTRVSKLEKMLMNHQLKESELAGRINVLIHRLKGIGSK